MLPIHPQPQKEELLSSWITRLAIENGLFSHVFFKSLLGFNGAILNRDIDRLESPEFHQLLSLNTHNSIINLRKLHLCSYQGELYEKINLSGNTRWILPTGIYHRTKKRRGIVYCPLCLREDNIKHFRKYWRLSFVTICHKHACLLLDECSYCKTPVDYQRLGIGSKNFERPLNNLDLCHNCNEPLSHGPIKYLELSADLISQPYLNFLTCFHQELSVIPLLKQPLNLQLFDGLWLLVNTITSNRADKVRVRLLNRHNIEIKACNKKSFDYLSISERRNILLLTLFYLEHWPNKFLSLVSGTKFTRSSFSDYATSIPFWLDSLINQHINLKRYTITNEEIMSAINYLKTREGYIDKFRLTNLLGLHISSLIKRLDKMQGIDSY